MVGREYNWYVVYTRTQHEKKLHQDLERISVESYLPLIETVSFWSDRKKIISRPLFPNYLFVRISCREYHWLAGNNRVIGFVKSGDELSVIRDDLFEAMVKIVRGRMEYTLNNNSFEPGTSVRVTGGPLSGISGIVIKKEGNSYLTVEIKPVNKTFIVRIPEDHVIHPDYFSEATA